MTNFISYKEGYKYQLVEPLTIQTRVRGYSAKTDFIQLFLNGIMMVFIGYAWDGATGFPDIKAVMRGSCGHDALYQLIRMGLIPESCKEAADKTFADICEADFKTIYKKMPLKNQLAKAFGNSLLFGVDKFGFIGLGSEREIKTAP